MSIITRSIQGLPLNRSSGAGQERPLAFHDNVQLNPDGFTTAIDIRQVLQSRDSSRGSCPLPTGHSVHPSHFDRG